jgi:hypothetical protein
MVWELSLGPALFVYLFAVVEREGARTLLTALFLPYALVDLWRLAGVGLFGFEAVSPGGYLMVDPMVYVPFLMVIILVFYALLVSRLWGSAWFQHREAPAGLELSG